MAISFQNMATLSYNGGQLNSNVVTGQIQEVITARKNAVLDQYQPDGTVTYAITLTNSSAAPVTGLTLADDLGGYEFAGATVYPLAYEAGSVQYYVNGALQAAPTVTAGPPMTVSGISVPAGGSAMVLYQARVTRYAPLAQGAAVNNTVSVSGGGLISPITAAETVTAASSPSPSISKSLEPSVVTENGRLTYTFVIQNSGNTPIVAGDNVILRDTFNPVLNGLTVTYNGAAWTEGTQYTYAETTGEFATAGGSITVPAATYTQDPATGVWSVSPGTSTLIVTGTV